MVYGQVLPVGMGVVLTSWVFKVPVPVIDAKVPARAKVAIFKVIPVPIFNVPFMLSTVWAVFIPLPAQVKLLNEKGEATEIFWAAPFRLMVLPVTTNVPEVKVAEVVNVPATLILALLDRVTLLVVLTPLMVRAL